MKLKHYVIIIAILLALITIQVQAKDGVVIYKVLVDRVDPKIPLFTQSRLAYNRLLPDLMDSKNKGTIVSYSPDFSAGILKVEFANVSDLSSYQDGQKIFTDLNKAAAVVQRSITKKQPASDISTAAYNPRFFVSLYSNCAYISGIGAFNHLIGSLQDSSGRKLGNFEIVADGNNTVRGCFYNSDVIRPGYKIVFKIFTASNVLKNSFTVTVPSIKFATIDKVKSIISGSGPAGKPFSISWYQPLLDASAYGAWNSLSGFTKSNGSWSVDFGTTPFRGGDSFTISFTQSPQFTFGRNFTAPYIYCTIGKSACSAAGFPNQSVTMKVLHAGKTLSFSGKYNDSGWFDFFIMDSSGNPVLLAAGDTVSGTNFPAWKLLPMSATADYTNDIVSGIAPANKWLWVGVGLNNPYNYIYYWWNWAQANSSSVYSAGFRSSVDIDPNKSYDAWIESTNTVSGNTQAFHQYFEP